MLIHKMDVIESINAPIIDVENYMISVCNEYYIDYNTCECKKVQPTDEGLLSKFISIVKTIFQQAIKILVKIWKMLVGFFKRVVSTVLNFIKRLLGLKKSKTKVNVKASFIGKSCKLIKTTFSNRDQMCSAFKTAFTSIGDEIKKRNRENIELMRQSERDVMQHVKESFVTLTERVGYNTGFDNMGQLNDINSYIYELRSDIQSGNLDKYKTDIFGDELPGKAEDYAKAKLHAYEIQQKDELTNTSWNGHDAVTQGNSYAEHISVAHIGMLNTKMMEKTLEAEDIIEAYDTFMKDSIDEFYKYANNYSYTTSKQDGQNINRLNSLSGACREVDKIIQNILKTKDLMAEQIDAKYAKEVATDKMDRSISDKVWEWFPLFYDVDPGSREKAIRQWLQLRINWNKGIIACLQNMLTLNAEFLGISEAEMRVLISDLGNESLDSTKALLYKNMDKFLSPDHCILDARPIGLGVIVVSDRMAAESFNDMTVDNSKWKLLFNNVNDFERTDTMITYLTKYDLTILSHGGDDFGVWVIERTKLPNGNEVALHDMDHIKLEEYLRECIKLGFKRINILSCNPGGHKLPNDLIKSNKVLIRMSLRSTLAI